MVRCLDCEYCMFEEDVDVEYEFGEVKYIGYDGWYECRFGYKKFNTEKEVDCKRFKPRTIECPYCKEKVLEKDFNGISCNKDECCKRARLELLD